MKRRQPDYSRQPERLQSYLDCLTRIVGHADRVVPLENYTKGLLLPLERKSVEPMAARLAAPDCNPPGTLPAQMSPLPA